MGRSPRRPGARDVNGILIFDKPSGVSSNQALQRVRRLFNARKAGHTGALDVLATGLLPLCFGEATKLSGYLLDADKAYRATFRLGIATDSGDAEGEVIATNATASVDACSLRDAMAALTGDIRQVPPMHSALKRDGRPLYELARRGIEVEREARSVRVSRFELLSWEGDDVQVAIRCSKGTYIRSLAIDLGRLLGCGAHVTALRRTDAGPFSIDAAVTLEGIEAQIVDGGDIDALLVPMDRALEGYPEVALDAPACSAVRQGRPVRVASPPPGLVRLYGPGREFVGLGVGADDGRVAPKRLISGA